jgi:hypothetical protein
MSSQAHHTIELQHPVWVKIAAPAVHGGRSRRARSAALAMIILTV